MVVYEVNLDIKNEIYEDYKTWLISHVKEILQIQGFLEAKILKEQGDHKDIKKLTCCYLIDSQENLDNYIANHAATMRQDGIKRFGDKFTATRRVFDVVTD